MFVQVCADARGLGSPETGVTGGSEELKLSVRNCLPQAILLTDDCGIITPAPGYSFRKWNNVAVYACRAFCSPTDCSGLGLTLPPFLKY